MPCNKTYKHSNLTRNLYMTIRLCSHLNYIQAYFILILVLVSKHLKYTTKTFLLFYTFLSLFINPIHLLHLDNVRSSEYGSLSCF